MTRNTVGSALYGLIFHDGKMYVIYAVALIQAISYCTEKPRRVIVFEGDVATCIDEATLETCWNRLNY